MMSPTPSIFADGSPTLSDADPVMDKAWLIIGSHHDYPLEVEHQQFIQLV